MMMEFVRVQPGKEKDSVKLEREISKPMHEMRGAASNAVRRDDLSVFVERKSGQVAAGDALIGASTD